MNLKFLEDSGELYDYELKKNDLPYYDSEEENDILSSVIKPFFDFEEIQNNDQIPKTDNNKVTSDIEPKFKLFNIIKVKNKIILENEINELFKKMNIKEKDFFLDLNNNCEEIEKIRNKLKLSKKRTKKLYKEINLIKQTKRGRRKKDDTSKRRHNKYSPDIIIKAIKTKINVSLILFLNKIINTIYNFDEINHIFHSLDLPEIKSNSELNEVFKKNNYNYRANFEDKFYNLKILKSTIKEYFSNEISTKYTRFPKGYNELIINYFLNDDNHKNIFNFLFNMTIDDWLNIFIYKREINDLTFFNTLRETELNVIKENLVRIDEYIIDIYGYDKIYFHCFMLLIFNFKRYFEFKEKRTTKKIKDN